MSTATTPLIPDTNDHTRTAGTLSCRPEIRVLDCTIRNGGLMNQHHFEDHFVKAVHGACVASGIDYMEVSSRRRLKTSSSTRSLVVASAPVWT